LIPLELNYELGPGVYLAYRRMTERNGLREFRNGFWSWCALVAGVGLVGLAAAVMAASLVLSIVFVVVLGAVAYEAASYRRRYDAILEKGVARLPVRTVTLRIDDSGLHESVAGVEYFAPWSAVRSYASSPEAFALELASGSWSVIPVSAFSAMGGPSLSTLIAALEQQAIPARAP
jgi:hypothetical protein